MTGRITAQQFHEAGGVDDWRVVFEGACTHFATGSFSKVVALVEAIGRLGDEAEHHPKIDLRYGGVTVSLMSDDVGGFTDRDVALAQQISQAALELGVSAEPSLVQTMQVAIDAHVHADVMPSWRAVLGYDALGDEDLVDPRGRGPSLWFQRMQDKREGRNRLHVDVSVPPDPDFAADLGWAACRDAKVPCLQGKIVIAEIRSTRAGGHPRGERYRSVVRCRGRRAGASGACGPDPGGQCVGGGLTPVAGVALWGPVLDRLNVVGEADRRGLRRIGPRGA